MNVGTWVRKLLAGAACLAVVGTVCLPAAGCARRKQLKGEAQMPEKAKLKAEQMREQGTKDVGEKAGQTQAMKMKGMTKEGGAGDAGG